MDFSEDNDLQIYIYVYIYICIYIYILTCFYDSGKGGTAYVCIFLHHGHPTNIHYWFELGILKEFPIHYQ